jgi:hypothetical protein
MGDLAAVTSWAILRVLAVSVAKQFQPRLGSANIGIFVGHGLFSIRPRIECALSSNQVGARNGTGRIELAKHRCR